MYPILSGVLLLLSLGLVGYPFWKEWAGDSDNVEWNGSEAMMAYDPDKVIRQEKDRVMNTLSEIEFDYYMKKLSYDDYQHLKNDYAQAAITMIEVERHVSNLNAVKGERDHCTSISIDSSQIEREIEADLQSLSERDDYDLQQ